MFQSRYFFAYSIKLQARFQIFWLWLCSSSRRFGVRNRKLRVRLESFKRFLGRCLFGIVGVGVIGIRSAVESIFTRIVEGFG